MTIKCWIGVDVHGWRREDDLGSGKLFVANEDEMCVSRLRLGRTRVLGNAFASGGESGWDFLIKKSFCFFFFQKSEKVGERNRDEFRVLNEEI